jgi:hypothetical protein
MEPGARIQGVGATAAGLVSDEVADFLVRDLATWWIGVRAGDSEFHRWIWLQLPFTG